MNQRLPLILSSLLLLFLTAVLSSCAPTPGGAPSPALREQLQQLKTQQQQHDEQLRIMQQQLSQIEKALGIEPTVESTVPAHFPEGTVPQPSYTQRPEFQTPETTAYLTAFNHLAGARYAAAEAGFASFLNQYPNHQQAPDARFRLADAQISQGKYDLAASHLRQIITDPNAQSRTPAAMLQLVQLYRQQGRTAESQAMLQQLRERYPTSPEAQE